MTQLNAYWQQLTDEQIRAGEHRDLIGGLWEELGELQFKFLLSAGLRPEHTLCDVGCGAGRGGIRFIDYLDQGHYHGTDINASLLKAAEIEVAQANLAWKKPRLHLIDDFDLTGIGERFDFAVSISLITHLPINHAIMCIKRTVDALKAGGSYFCTYFEAPAKGHFEPITHAPGGITTHYERDPYHLSFEEIEILAGIAGAHVERIGDWHHPRNQRMARFFRS